MSSSQVCEKCGHASGKKDKQINFRISAELLSDWKVKAKESGLSLSDWIVSRVQRVKDGTQAE